MINGHLQFSSFDPTVGADSKRPLPISGPDHVSMWDLSPDGKRIAIAGGIYPTDHLTIADVDSGRTMPLPLAERVSSTAVAWMPDGRNLIVTASPADVGSSRARGSKVLYVNAADQSVRTIWSSDYQLLSDPVIAPDAKHVAFSSFVFQSNAWAIERRR